MQIEFDNELVERFLEMEIKSRVNVWFTNHRDFIKDIVKKTVEDEVKVQLSNRELDIQRISQSLQTKKLAEEITNCIGLNIASHFINKYDYD